MEKQLLQKCHFHVFAPRVRCLPHSCSGLYVEVYHRFVLRRSRGARNSTSANPSREKCRACQFPCLKYQSSNLSGFVHFRSNILSLHSQGSQFLKSNLDLINGCYRYTLMELNSVPVVLDSCDQEHNHGSMGRSPPHGEYATSVDRP